MTTVGEVPSSRAHAGAPEYGDVRQLHPVPRRTVVLVVAAQVLLLTALSGRYGYHRDELYFRVAAEHLAWGYVDQPPLTPLLAAVGTGVFGDSLVGLRVIATLISAATVLLVVLIARELGGSGRAQMLAAGCAASSAMVLALGHMLATATVDFCLWLLLSWLALRLLRSGDPRWFLPIGVVIGIGVLNKYLILLLAGGLLVSLLLVGPRTVLRSPWLVVGALVAAAIAAPNIAWQAANGWPQLHVAAGIAADQGAENRALFVPLQVVYLSPLFIPVWVAGIVRLLRDPESRWARSMVVTYGLLVVAVVAAGGKAYYVLPLLLVLTAAGTEPVVRAIPSTRTLVAAVGVAAAVSVAVTLPVLPPSTLGPVNAMNAEQGEQVGWPELAETVAESWALIPAEQRADAVIFTINYGQAGALERYGPEWGLPTPYSGHMAYSDWAVPPDDATGPVLVVADRESRTAETYFTDCEIVAMNDNGHGLANDERDTVVRLCRGTVAPWSTLWPQLRRLG